MLRYMVLVNLYYFITIITKQLKTIKQNTVIDLRSILPHQALANLIILQEIKATYDQQEEKALMNIFRSQKDVTVWLDEVFFLV